MREDYATFCVAFWRASCYNVVVERKIHAHWGTLLVRWLYAILMLGPAFGLSYLTQYLWHIQWYTLFAVIAGVLVLAMVYNTVNTLRTRVTHNDHGDALVVTDGVLGTRTHTFRYDRMISYRTKPSRLDAKLGCVQLVLCAAVGAGEQEEYTLCLSAADADIVLEDLHRHLSPDPSAR